MAKLTFIKHVNSREIVNSYQLLLNSIFGNKLPKEYDSTVNYMKGDSIIVIQEDGSYLLQVAKENGLTGDYLQDKWNTVSFTSLFGEGSALDIDFSKTIQVSETQPVDKDNMLWLQPIKEKGDGGENIVMGGVIIYENEHFAAQHDEPSSEDQPGVRLWLDYE